METRALNADADEISYPQIRKQLFVLGLFPFSEHIAWSSTLPYIYAMVKSFDKSGNTASHPTALYAALLVSCFTFGEFLMAPQWARISDRIGRKPTLLVGSFSAIFSAAAFGFSTSLPMALTSRFLAGALNPNLGVLKTYIGELVTRDKQARGFSSLSFMQGLGSICGPIVGGYLAEPTRKLPSVFVPGSIWEEFPYLLPNLVVVICLATSCILGFIFLQEVHPDFRDREDVARKALASLWRRLRCWKRNSDAESYTRIGANDREPPEETDCLQPQRITHTIDRRKAFTTQINLQILSATLESFKDIGAISLVPIFLGSPQPSMDHTEGRTLAGGFGLRTEDISSVLLTEAIAAIFCQLFLIPQLIERQGALRSYRMTLIVCILLYALMPISLKFQGSGGILTFMVLLWIQVFLMGTASTATSMMITNNAPSPIYLATINGAAASCGCLAKTGGPALVGFLYDLGIENGSVVVPFWTLGAVAALTLALTAVLLNHSESEPENLPIIAGT